MRATNHPAPAGMQGAVMRLVLLASLATLSVVGCDDRARSVAAPQNQICSPLMSERQIAAIRYNLLPLTYPKPSDPEDVIDPSKVDMDTPDTWEEVAADCVIATARKYSDKTDEAQSVAIAVLQECKPDLDNLELSVHDAVCGPKANEDYLSCQARRNLSEDRIELMDQDADDAVKAIKTAEMNAAIHYVVEARSGHCTVDRLPPGSVPWPFGFARIKP